MGRAGRLMSRPPQRHARQSRRASIAVAVLAVGLLLAAAAALAGDRQPARTPAELFARFDADGDGRVSEREYLDYLSRGFDYLDANRDGRVDAAELPVGARLPRARDRHSHRIALAAGFRRQDHDQDGWLNALELSAPPR